MVCENNNVTELDDTVTKDVSRNWQKYSAKTVYLAFYCKKANSVNDVSTDNRKCNEVDPQKTSKTKKTKSDKEAKLKRTEEKGNVHQQKGKERSQSNGEI